LRDIFFIADTHFGHEKIIEYGERPFSSREEMDQVMIGKWNSVVGPSDKVYHLGDFGLQRASEMVDLCSSLHGRKILIKGNHDNLKLSSYSKVFSDIRGTHLLGTGLQNGPSHLVLSHVPLHPEAIKDGWVNVHGHRHQRGSPEGPYLSVSVEMIGYKPISFEDILNLLIRKDL